MGNKGFPKFNPQSEFTSDEENSTFQGIFMPMDTLHPEETGAAKLTLQSKVLDHTVYTSSNLVKILILTKGVDFFDTLRHGISFLEMSCLFLYSAPSNTAARISARGSMALCISSLVLVWAPTSMRVDRGSICRLKR